VGKFAQKPETVGEWHVGWWGIIPSGCGADSGCLASINPSTPLEEDPEEEELGRKQGLKNPGIRKERRGTGRSADLGYL